MRGCLGAGLLVLIAAVPGPAVAQNAEEFPEGSVGFPIVENDSQILTVDLERLFGQSLFGERVRQDYSDARIELATENQRIAEALREEELSLTERRPNMEPEVFREEAEAFDEKAQGIRRAQDAKEQALEQLLLDRRDQFLEAARPILGELLIARNASVIVEQRGVIVSLNRIDVTEEALEQINAVLGDGREAPPEE